MKQRIVNVFVTVLAIVGIFIFLGAIGNMDYSVEVGIEYPLIDTIKMLFVGLSMTVPAVVREVLF